MKRIITLLLAMTMCLCLINIKNNNVKAQDELVPKELCGGAEFNKRIREFTSTVKPEKIIFKKVSEMPTTEEYVDLSNGNDKSILGVWDEEGNLSIVTKEENIIKFQENCQSMFEGNSDYDNTFGTLISVDFGDETVIDTSAVKDMSKMFYGAFYLEEINFGNGFDTSLVETMDGMFCECYSLGKINFGEKFNSSSLENTKSMFANCWLLTQINLPSTFTCESVTNMQKMFSTCLNLTSLDLSNFKTGAAKDAERMFQGCVSLSRIYVNENEEYFKNATNTDHMFWNCESLIGQKSTVYDVDHLDKEYARIDDPDNNKPGYFSSVNVISKYPAVYNSEDGKFYIGESPVDENVLSYNPNTKVVTMNGFIHDISNIEERNYALIVPHDTKEIKVLGNNCLNNMSEKNYRRYLIGIEDEDKDNFSFYFTGNGTLTLSNTYYDCALGGKSIVFNGPTINAYANPLDDGKNATIVANNIKVLSGSVNTTGTVGIAIVENDEDDASSRPSFEVTGGKVIATGMLSAFGEQLLTDKAIEPKATVVGASQYPFEDNLTSNLKLIEDENAEKHMFGYYDLDNEDIVYYAEFTKYVNPDPAPTPKDESCEKVIGPTWHWNNKKGICEDTGVVKTYTR